MDHKQLIELGIAPCRKIKGIYYKDIPWHKCHQQVATKYTELKAFCRKFYVDMNEIELHQTIAQYSEKDIKDTFDDHELSHKTHR